MATASLRHIEPLIPAQISFTDSGSCTITFTGSSSESLVVGMVYGNLLFLLRLRRH